ncbi:uncharacterized protein LOC125496639 [Beta vulgaris subsp. vulgaris]|uniref:uncharacterized protein LOC125496639 n=1 Tax=Beta vulgaris subsp. vulgaris TaxID=3555 RepID=UPI002547837E|nr:uncharacterized protein LOC125496639 [Beta vulgaris subsp. vulgaris]
MEEYFSVPVPTEDTECIGKLNADQRHAYDTVMNAITLKNGGAFFVDGPGGTGKTYLYRAILATIKGRGEIAIPTTTSGIAATLLHQGRSSHSTFQLPLKPDSSSSCTFTKGSKSGILLKHSSVIIWDEAPMTHRYQFEAVDRSLKDLMGNDLPFGGKIIVFGGDFRQVLPVVRNGTRAQMIDASLIRSPLWNHISVLQLRENMRSRHDNGFANFLLSIGNGDEPTISDDMIKLPSNMVIPTVADTSIDGLIDQIFPNLNEHIGDGNFMVERAIITPLNENADRINDKVIERFLGEGRTYYSFDSVPDDTRNLYQQEFLNSIVASGLPPHVLKLKPGVPLMLLRNIDPKNGLCKGTRLLCHSLKDHFIDAEILTGHARGNRVFLPRIPLKTAEDIRLPFEMVRKQFPVKLSFGLTINKSQGQTIPHVGIYLPDHVFSHGQLYVALSRGISENTTKITVDNGKIRGKEGVFTKNIVYKEVLLLLHSVSYI